MRAVTCIGAGHCAVCQESIGDPIGSVRTHQHPWAHGPPAPTGTVVVDARTGTAYPVDARTGTADLPYPKIHDESLRFRAGVRDPCADFDQTGFAWPRAPAAAADAPGHAELLADDYTQPAAAASEPVFWKEPTRPVRPDDQSPFYADADPADPRLTTRQPTQRVCLRIFFKTLAP